MSSETTAITTDEKFLSVVQWSDLPLGYRLKAIAVTGIVLGLMGGIAFVADMKSALEEQIASAFEQIEESMGALLTSPDAAFDVELRNAATARLASFRFLASKLSPARCEALTAIAAEALEIPVAQDAAFHASATSFIARGRDAVDACGSAAQ